MCLEADERKGIAELKLSKAFYPPKIINNAIKQFKGVKITKKEANGYFHITMKCENSSAEKLALEFCNYVLASMKTSLI